MVTSLGTVRLRLVEAFYEEELIEGPVRSYCNAWLLEKTRWRRRHTAESAEDPLHPRWDQTFEVEGVRDDAKVVVDVYNAAAPEGSYNEFFGKVTLKLSELLTRPTSAWHELLPGRIHIQLFWIPTMDGEPTGAPILLTLPESGNAGQAALLATSARNAASPLQAPQVRVQGAKPPAPPPMDPAEAKGGAAQGGGSSKASTAADKPLILKMDHYEYTHRGGSGHGPKENQDAYFTIEVDERNRVFGVLDGHGGEHGRVASHAAADAMKMYLQQNFDQLRTQPEKVMEEAFSKAHQAIWEAIKAMPDVFEKDGMLCMEVEEEDWPLGYDAVDGGSTASIAAIVDGRTLVYAAVGDSAGLLACPKASARGYKEVEELIAEHSPVRLDEWSSRLSKTEVEVVYDHPNMFEGPDQMLRVFCKDGKGGWQLDVESIRRADETGCGFKTERGDRSAVIMTPESGKFSQMMLNVTRSLGDFYHQQYGITWRPEVVVRDLAAELGADGEAVLCVASDGVWDLWTFEDAMAELVKGMALLPASNARRQLVLNFMDTSRAKGEEAFGDSADNLTGIVVFFSTK